MSQHFHLTNLQLELLKMFSFNLDDKQLAEIRELLSKYFAQNVTEEMDKLWEGQNWSEETMQEWSKQHLRTTK